MKKINYYLNIPNKVSSSLRNKTDGEHPNYKYLFKVNVRVTGILSMFFVPVLLLLTLNWHLLQRCILNPNNYIR